MQIRRLEGETKSTSRSLARSCQGRGVIAKGKRIRDVRRLVAKYGGKASQWVKKSGPRMKIAGEYFELHWYEHPGLGRFEVKLVGVNRS